MVQQIYNNYSPQYNYDYRQLPSNIQTQALPYNPYNYDIYQRPPQQDYWAAMAQFAQRLPQYVMPNYYVPDTQSVTQNVYNQPVYAQSYYSSPPSEQQSINNLPANAFVNASQHVDSCSWVQDPDLKMALNKLAEITHDPADVAYIRSIGATPPFNSGKEAIDFIANNQIRVEFVDMGDSLAHAQWINDQSIIGINKKYKGQMTVPMALAIADAIYHEAGHAKDRDGVASVQEELDCLALNVLGYRYQQRMYPEIMNANQQSRLLSDGVALYPKLFFDSDPYKKGLVNRVTEKYGYLPLTSPNHTTALRPLAAEIKNNFNARA